MKDIGFYIVLAIISAGNSPAVTGWIQHRHERARAREAAAAKLQRDQAAAAEPDPRRM